MYSDNLRRRMEVALADPQARDELESALSGGSPYATHWYVNGFTGAGSDTQHDGRSADKPYATMGHCFEQIDDGAVIHLVGPILENLTAPVGITGVTIRGDANAPRWGSLTNASEGPAASWRTASGVTATPLLILINQGWVIENILFAGPSAETAIQIKSDGTVTPEITGGNCVIRNCRFAAGKYAITDNGGSGWVWIFNNDFEVQTTGSIVCVSVASAASTGYRIEGNRFWAGSASHILASLTKSFVTENTFMTVASTARYVDLIYNSGTGASNVVCHNIMAGEYAKVDYNPTTTDIWYQNTTVVKATESPDGRSILPPA